MNQKTKTYYPAACIYTALLFLLPFLTTAQKTINNPVTALDNFSNKNLQEKIFVHVGKQFYVTSEIVWFKLYVTDARLHVPIDVSKVAYVELLDAKNTPVQQAKIKLSKGNGNGSFQLSASLPSGYYRIRAYTSWMKNYDADYFFEKQITIVNTYKSLPHASPEIPAYKVQLFPEGGNLLMNVNNVVAFKITDQHGKGVDGSGILLNQRKDTITRFNSLHAGMGRFEFNPQPGNDYKVKMTVNGGSMEAVLPSIYATGYNLHLSEVSPDQLTLTVSANGAGNGENILFLSHTRGKKNSVETKAITNGKAVFIIDKTSLPPGITTFTIFNNSGEPVAERLYFKKPQPSSLSVRTDQSDYSLREKISAGFSLANQPLLPGETANLSVSVHLLDSLQTEDKNGIIPFFWLSSDIKGEIENPAYYFGENSGEAADILMMTQGWRRFAWKDVIENKKPLISFLPEYEGHLVTGRIINKSTGLPAPDIMGYLSSPARAFQFSANLSNEQGLVYFNLKDLSGTENLVLQTDPAHHADSRLDIVSPFSESFPYTPLLQLDISPSLLQQVYYQGINSQVQSIYNNDSLNKFYLPADSSLFFGKVDKSYKLDDYTRFTTMEEVLREYVAEVAPHKQGHNFHLNVLKAPDDFYDADPLVLVDGVPFFDMDSVMAIDPLKIQRLDIVKREYILGPVKTSGLLSYSTYKGDLEGIRLSPDAIVVDYEGLQLRREFYTPVYETDLQKNDRLPDLRNQLYWNPDVNISTSAGQNISFYTSDLQGKYLIEVQGVSTQGKILSASYIFEVKK